MGETTAMRDADARRALRDDLERLQCRVHQPDDPPLFTREPRSTMEPVHWRWRELLPMLDRLGALIEIGSVAGNPVAWPSLMQNLPEWNGHSISSPSTKPSQSDASPCVQVSSVT